MGMQNSCELGCKRKQTQQNCCKVKKKTTLDGPRSEAGKGFLVESEGTCMLLGRKRTNY